MATKVILPKQGLQMTEGIINSWLAKEGDAVFEGKPLFEIETDKVTIEIDSPASGKLLKILHGKGETVPVADVIGIIGEENEDISALLSNEEPKKAEAAGTGTDKVPVNVDKESKEAKPEPSGGRIFISPRAKMTALQNGVDFVNVDGTGPDGLIVEKDIKAYIENPVKATPLAKKVAAIENLPLGDIQGSGARGKIVKADVTRMSAKRVSQAGQRAGKIIPFAGMRKVIAERMSESMHTAAQATHRIKADMSEAEKIKNTYKAANKKVSYNDIIAYAVCRSLKDFPIMNSELTAEGILLKDFVNLGIAVAVDNGLIVPVIRDADIKNIEEIGEETRMLAEKAKNGKLLPDDYTDGSFTVSNLGMYGLNSFTAIINPPESGILAVGTIEKTPVVIDSEITIRPIVTLTLTYDHRVVDGAPAAQFLSRIKEYLEKPYLLL